MSPSSHRHLRGHHKSAYLEYRGKRQERMEDSAMRLSKLDDRFKSEEYECEPCRTSFSSEKSWVKHMQRHKVEIEKALPLTLQSVCLARLQG